MKILNGHTKRAQRLIENANRFTGFSLDDIYTSYSIAKANAWKWCYNQFVNTENSERFRVGNANTFGFSASWYGTSNGESILRYETKDNSYLVLLDR